MLQSEKQPEPHISQSGFIEWLAALWIGVCCHSFLSGNRFFLGWRLADVRFRFGYNSRNGQFDGVRQTHIPESQGLASIRQFPISLQAWPSY
jgi:hypothetical protein